MTKPKAKPIPRGFKDMHSLFQVLKRDAERAILHDAFLAADGNMSEAARILGIQHQLFANRADLLGGVLPGQPRKEPYKVPSNAKHHDGDSSADDEDDDSDPTSDDDARATDGGDAEQAAHRATAD